MSQGKMAGLIAKRNRCYEALQRAQAALNRALIASGPAQQGDIIQDVDGKIFRVLAATVKTMVNEHGLTDRVMYEFQKKHVSDVKTCWQRVGINTAGLTERVLSGTAKVVRHARK